MTSFAFLQEAELKRARRLHPKITNSYHEGYAVILEEVDELWDEVKRKTSERDPNAAREELVQIAAMCQKMAEDLGLMEDGSHEILHRV